MSDRDIKITRWFVCHKDGEPYRLSYKTKEDAELASYFDSDTVHKFKLVRIK